MFALSFRPSRAIFYGIKMAIIIPLFLFIALEPAERVVSAENQIPTEAPVGERPYEMIWAGRVEERLPLVDFEELCSYGIDRLIQCNHEITWRDGPYGHTPKDVGAPLAAPMHRIQLIDIEGNDRIGFCCDIAQPICTAYDADGHEIGNVGLEQRDEKFWFNCVKGARWYEVR